MTATFQRTAKTQALGKRYRADKKPVGYWVDTDAPHQFRLMGPNNVLVAIAPQKTAEDFDRLTLLARGMNLLGRMTPEEVAAILGEY